MALHKFKQSRSYILDLELESQRHSIPHSPIKPNNHIAPSPPPTSIASTLRRFHGYCSKLTVLRLQDLHHALALLSWPARVRNSICIAAILCIIYFGDSRSNLVALLAFDPRIHRIPLYVGVVCLTCDVCMLSYVSLLQLAVPEFVLVAFAVVALLTFMLFSYALWPIWGLLVLPMLLAFFMAFGAIVAPCSGLHVSLEKPDTPRI